MIAKCETLRNLPVYDWASGQPLRSNALPRISWSADFRPESADVSGLKRFVKRYLTRPEPPPEQWPQLMSALVKTAGSREIPGLVIGFFGGAESDDAVHGLIEVAPKLPAVRTLFVGDMVSEECEISWMTQCDFEPLLAAFPQLEYLGIRGLADLSFSAVKHKNLRHLVLEGSNLAASVVRSILAGELPALEHLEIWLGTPDYGADTRVEDLVPLLRGDVFPSLRYLGLRNAEIADEVALALTGAPILDRLQVLDLSLGTLSDVGGGALLSNPAIANLKKLDLNFHYMSDEMMAQFKALPLEVDVDDPQGYSDRDGYRFVAVSE